MATIGEYMSGKICEQISLALSIIEFVQSTRIYSSLFLAQFSDNTPLCRFQSVF